MPEPPARSVELREQERPVGETDGVNVTSSAKPPLELTVMRTLPMIPTGKERLAGADMEKSIPRTVTDTMRE